MIFLRPFFNIHGPVVQGSSGPADTVVQGPQDHCGPGTSAGPLWSRADAGHSFVRSSRPLASVFSKSFHFAEWHFAYTNSSHEYQ